MSEALRRIELKDLTNDPGKLTRMWILQLIAQHDEPLPVSQLANTIKDKLKTADPKTLRLDITPHNSLKELLNGMSGLGLVNGTNIVQLTSHGQRLITFLPPGIPEALGFRNPEPASQA